MAPPRALYCEFPLGRPLGRPDDPALQRDVLDRALALVEASEAVLETYPLTIESDETPLACSNPASLRCPPCPPPSTRPRDSEPPYERSLQARRVTEVGRAIGADQVTDALGRSASVGAGRVVEGDAAPGQDHHLGLPRHSGLLHRGGPAARHRPRAGCPLGGGVGSSRRPKQGKTMLAARTAIREQGAPFPFWFYMVPRP